MNWIKVDWPPEGERVIRCKGGEPLHGWMHLRKGRCLVVLLSREPSGEGGAMEYHASVSYSIDGVRRWPSELLTRKALAKAGFPPTCEIFKSETLLNAYTETLEV